MIRQATHKDTLVTVALLRKFLGETAYKQAALAAKDLEHLSKIVWTCLQYGYVWLAYNDEEPIGMLMAVKEPNMWLPRANQLRELVWYVVPEHRHTTVGGKLFLTYCQRAQKLLDTGVIDGYFTTRMSSTDPIDYERRGFRLTEQTYLKE